LRHDLLQILVVGPSGCGKSECIKTFAVAERERGKSLSIQSVFTKAFHPKAKEERVWAFRVCSPKLSIPKPFLATSLRISECIVLLPCYKTYFPAIAAIVVDLCVCVRVAKIGTSVFRNADIPKIGGSDYRSAEMPIFGISGLRSRQQRNVFVLRVYKSQRVSV